VLKFLVSQLADISEKIEYENNPKIKKLRSIQHLISKIEARLKTDVSIIEIIERLFPTPAVCGFPKVKAIDVIQNLESFDRGLYAGILGWITPQNESEFAVAIRSAFIKGRKLRAFVGCGIIKESDAEAEFNETELKFKTIISLFENENIN
jgi:menaquinone-specific isochorismate synthase